MLLALVALLSACRKDDVSIASLNSNPFDADFEGEDLFVSEGTELIVESIPNIGAIGRQVIRFRVRSELFLPGQASRPYSVRVVDGSTGGVTYLDRSGSEDHRFTYTLAEPMPDEQVCLELRLANNFSVARPETICAIL
jgi:hypothetical protein